MRTGVPAAPPSALEVHVRGQRKEAVFGALVAQALLPVQDLVGVVFWVREPMWLSAWTPWLS
jgi:hypothetical protein